LSEKIFWKEQNSLRRTQKDPASNINLPKRRVRVKRKESLQKLRGGGSIFGDFGAKEGMKKTVKLWVSFSETNQ